MAACAKKLRGTVRVRKGIQLPMFQHSTPNAQSATRPRFDLEERLLDFSVRIIQLVDALPNTTAANHVAGQLLGCGGSAYGNHGEVEVAESRKNFVHKLKVCLKALKKTRRWLRLLAKSSMLPETKPAPVLNETEELIRIFFSSIRTAETIRNDHSSSFLGR
jgi:four helix bundle protein